MPSPINSALLFLVTTLFDLYLMLLVIRLLLAYVQVNYFNPIVQMIIKLTQPLVGPVKRVVPNYRRIEFATLLWILILEMIKFFIMGLITIGFPASMLGLLLLSIADIFKLILNTYFYGILLAAILSWVQPHSPVSQILAQMLSPVMRPIRRWVPVVGGFDISPIPAMILLQLIIIVVANPLFSLGLQTTFG